MRFIDWIIEELWNAADWFHEAYYEVKDWIWPFYLLKYPLYGLYGAFMWLAIGFSDFNEWIADIAGKVAAILSFDDIYSYFRDLFNAALNAWAWVADSFWNVWDIVTTWWAVTSSTVLDGIAALRDWALSFLNYLQEQIYALNVRVSEVIELIPDVSEFMGWFSDWWGNILANLGTWWDDRLLDIQGLIDSAFKTRESFWAGWQEWRDKVIEFFTDPEDWLYKAADRIIERFW